MTTRSAVRPPSWRRQVLEARWPLEAAALSMIGPSCPLLGRGDGHPVLVLPGFTADDVSTVPLRSALAAHGYTVHGWRLGRNLGPTSRAVAGMRALVEEFHHAGGERVSLVGWSLGGIYARLLARDRPALVRQVITLASPYRMIGGDRSVATPLWKRVEHLHDGELPMGGIAEDARPPLTVPATSIYTRDDGVVRWQLCVDEVGPAAPNPRAENIEVYGTHIGLGVNPAAVVAILDRLAQPEDEWRPFRPPVALRPWYPRPVSWSPDARRRAA
jgi:hypothetical protein